MRMRNLGLAAVMALTVAVPTTVGAQAARVTRHSGTIAAIDAQRGTLTLEEVGPWRREGDVTVVTRLSIGLTPKTTYNLLMRLNAPGGYAGDFAEVALEAQDVSAGDFVTVECRQEARRLVAVSVSVAELP